MHIVFLLGLPTSECHTDFKTIANSKDDKTRAVLHEKPVSYILEDINL